MKQSLRVIAILTVASVAAAFAPRASAQGVHYNDVARTADNTPLNNGLVAVCSANPTTPGNVGQPCAPLATIYTDATLSTVAANPINADIHGNFSLWAAPGTYFIEFYSPLRATAPFSETITLSCVPNSTAVGCGSGISRDVRAYGARCDDSTDDTAAIQAAVNSLPVAGSTIGGTISFSGVCKTSAAINVTTPDVTFVGTGHFQFITQNPPPSYIDFEGTTPQNAINVDAQGFAMINLGVKYPTTVGGPLAAPTAPVLTAIPASGCPAEAYFIEATYVSAQGETNISPEATITTTSGQCWQVTSPAAESGATGWRIYASSNSNNETLQVATLPIGTDFRFGGTLMNLGFRPSLNTTAYSAVFDPNGGQFDGVKIFTDLSASVGTASTANGYTSFGCCGKLQNVYIAGFGIGIFGEGSNNDFSVKDSYIQADNVGALVINGADIIFEGDDFEGNGVGNLKMLFGSPYKISGNYFEQQGSNPPSYNVQVGDTTIPPLSFIPIPGAITIDNNFMQCNLTVYPPAPIVVETSQVLDIERNSFSQCEHENIVDNTVPGSTAHIKMLGNVSDAQPLSWITHTTGLVESDVDGIGTTENPGTPYFYGLGIDSQSGASKLLFSSGGSPAWTQAATATAFSLGNNGTTAWTAAPFGSQTKPSLASSYAMTAAEVIVTQSGNSATFDAGLGNTFELIMNANVFGGGTVGATNGPCSTQQFYVSGSNAWAAGPMTINVTSGSAGLSLPAVSGTVPYFTGSWTNGDCLQAGGSPGLITPAAGACGAGGGGSTPGGSNTAVQFNSSGVFGGDATNFFYNSTTHNLTITGALNTAANSFALSQLANPAAPGDLLCGNSTPAWSDCTPGLQHRSANGNGLNDGRSWGSALGNADVGIAINAAIQSLPAAPKGGWVYLAPSSSCYTFSTQIVLDRPVHLISSGSSFNSRGACIEWIGGASAAVVINGASSGSSGSIFEGIDLENGGTGTVGIDIYSGQYGVGLTHVTIEPGSTTPFSVAGVRVGNDTSGPTIDTSLDDVRIASQVVGLDLLDANTVTCHPCHIYNSTTANVEIGDATHEAFVTTFFGGNIENDSTSTTIPSVIINNADAVNFFGVYTESDGGGNWMQVSNVSSNARGIRIYGGYFQGGGKTGNIFSLNDSMAELSVDGAMAINYAAGSKWISNTASSMVWLNNLTQENSNISNVTGVTTDVFSGVQDAGGTIANPVFPGLVVNALTSGDCVQAGTGGLLTTTAGPCPVSNGQTSAATNFGVNLTTQTIVASVPATGMFFVNVQPIVSTVGVGCSASSNTVSITISFTAPNGTVSTFPGGGLNFTGNGVLDTGAVANGLSFITAKSGTTITYTTTSSLGSTGCSTTPQYTVYAKAIL